jgi:prepilin-type N-terminal cleavage/methylation domain-containing protein
MTATTHRRPVRGGFTLIELLVVIGIIAILVSLTSAAVFKIFWRTTETRATLEVGELAGAMSNAENGLKLSGSVVPPSRLLLDESMRYDPSILPANAPPGWTPGCADMVKLAQDSKRFLHTAFPQARLGTPVDWNGDGIKGNTSFILEGDQCLVFWLSGIPSAKGSTPQGLGFSTNPSDPTAPAGPRLGPWFEFKSNRLVYGPSVAALSANLQPLFTYYSYVDPYGTNRPYAYFSSFDGQNSYNRYTDGNGNILSDCASLGVFPYQDGAGIYQKKDSFQIICAGKDGAFGAGGTWTPSTATAVYGPKSAGADDISNFYDAKLGISH